jgi:hypothetical protein
VRNKLRLVCKGYSQVEGIEFEETFSLVAKMEAIGMFLTFATHKDFKFNKIDVNYTFLNRELQEFCMEQSK